MIGRSNGTAMDAGGAIGQGCDGCGCGCRSVVAVEFVVIVVGGYCVGGGGVAGLWVVVMVH